MKGYPRDFKWWEYITVPFALIATGYLAITHLNWVMLLIQVIVGGTLRAMLGGDGYDL